MQIEKRNLESAYTEKLDRIISELDEEKLKSTDLIAKLNAYKEADKNEHNAAEAESAHNENTRRRIEVFFLSIFFGNPELVFVFRIWKKLSGIFPLE